MAAGIVPIIAPIGVDESGQTYNCNADTAAGAIAGALKAHRLLLLTDVAGVLNKEKELLQQIDSVKVGNGMGESARRPILLDRYLAGEAHVRLVCCNLYMVIPSWQRPSSFIAALVPFATCHPGRALCFS